MGKSKKELEELETMVRLWDGLASGKPKEFEVPVDLQRITDLKLREFIAGFFRGSN